MKDLRHIVGALGAGKSTYKFAQIYLGVRAHSLKMGVIEDSVSNVLNTVKTLRELNINAVPIIGSTSEKKYLMNYYTQLNKEDLEKDTILEYLSGACIVKALAEDFESDDRYPCNRIFEGNDLKDCPYSSRCGHMKRYRELINADVLVTTPHSLIKGSIPKFIDPYVRSVYELMYDILDMIIVDEADGIQSIFDGQLMPTVNLDYGENSLLKKFRDLRFKIEGNRREANKLNVYKFVNNVNRLETALTTIQRVLGKCTKIENYVSRKILTPTELFKNIADTLEKESINEKFIEYLREYVSFTDAFNITEDNITHELNELYNKIASIHLATSNNKDKSIKEERYPEKEIKESINNIFQRFNVTIPKSKRGKGIDEERFIEKICLLILLVQVDYILKVLSNEYPDIKFQVEGERSEIEVFGQINKKLTHLMKEPCIGTIYGYKLEYKEGITIEVMRYEGVGRSLLEQWHCIKNDIGKKGPAVICLSGTSFSPGSAHFNIKKKPDILLKGKEQGKITMKFLPKSNEEGYIRVSGVSLRDKRENNLKDLTKRIIREIQYELETQKGRKVLLVVNSYEDCNIVGEILKFNNLDYALIGKEANLDKKIISKDVIEDFKEITDGADICIVPLTIIARGYNILNDNNESYFGSLFFLIRPYMIPGDMTSYIQILHHYINYISEVVCINESKYYMRVKEFRKKCFTEFSKIVEIGYWKRLNDREREIMSWLMIVPIKQAIGRMQRNGSDCNVFFCDASFNSSILNNQKPIEANSVLHSWYKVLGQYKDDTVINDLYGGFYKALEEMLMDIDEEYNQEEEWEE